MYVEDLNEIRFLNLLVQYGLVLEFDIQLYKCFKNVVVFFNVVCFELGFVFELNF